METESTLPRSQQPNTFPDPALHEPSPLYVILFFQSQV
jgi:hypothetical protein